MAASCHQTDVGQFGTAVDEDDVGRFDVAVRQPVLVQVVECLGKAQADVQTIRRGPALTCGTGVVGAQGAWLVFHRVDVAAAIGIIAEFHHVIVERLAIRAAADVQDVHQRRVIAREWLELQDAFKLTLEAAFVLEILAPHHFHRAQCASDATCQPYFPVGAAADLAEHLVIRDDRAGADSSRHLRGLRVSRVRA